MRCDHALTSTPGEQAQPERAATGRGPAGTECLPGVGASAWFTQEHLLRLYACAPRAFWRHDVDVSLGCAVKLARFAHLAGVRATFYIMATGEFYNPFSPEGEHAIRSIRAAGHRLGLHCDFHGGGQLAAVNTVWAQHGLLERWYPGMFNAGLVSFHMPPPEVLWRDFDSFDSAYASRWEGHYVSDARREWDADKEAKVTASAADGVNLQVALHAEHWFS